MSDVVKSKAYPWALTGVFAALHLVITLIPFSLSISGTGIISFGMISATIVGFLLGPFFGVISVLIGSYLAMFFNIELAVIGFATPIATAAGALAAGLIRTRNTAFIPLFYAVTMALYFLSPLGFVVPELIWFHLIALALSILFVIPKTRDTLLGELELNKASTVRALFLLAIVCVTLDQLVGSTIGAFYFILFVGAPLEAIAPFYVSAVFIYPIERLIGSAVIVVVLGALIESLSSAYFTLPTSPISSGATLDLSEEEIQ
ncbi:MAG: hypothetical protein EAX95_09565 [Candidatus Thorarchaeota archaeon]|nr:hypothetical protein [Candidatus Thorarchaeota archaeon]